jgi:hypothetical protein
MLLSPALSKKAVGMTPSTPAGSGLSLLKTLIMAPNQLIVGAIGSFRVRARISG